MPRSRVSSTIEVHHRLLRGDVETGGRLVGDQQLRLAGERERDHDALAHAARELERIGVVALLGARDARPWPAPRSPSPSPSRASPGHAAAARPRSACRPCGSGSAPRAGSGRSSRSRARAGRASAPRRRSTRSMPENEIEPSAIRPAAVEDAHHRVGGHRLAGAGFADDGDRLALGDADVDRLHRLHRAAARGELDGEVPDVEERGGHELPVIARSGTRTTTVQETGPPFAAGPE